MAPEIKQDKVYDGRKIDVFSLGVIMWVLATGQFPFVESRLDDLHYKLLISEKEERLNMYYKYTSTEHLSDEFKALFLKMISIDPSKRPTIDSLQNDEWLNAPIDEDRIREDLKQTFFPPKEEET